MDIFGRRKKNNIQDIIKILDFTIEKMAEIGKL
jgi:hypothetical protein